MEENELWTFKSCQCDKVKVVYPHLGIQGEYLVKKIDNGVMELVAEETMKKIQE
ncbi:MULTISPECIES: hypothetical protein [Bacillus cereus group]|uniref:hypothetical protein n=1 Tax=Bacillus cereus group TaxID=86661 RepID=UPI0021D39C6E|nr:hypothetical protein [Bacillus paranthracis]MCU5610697.1 hypothetical protein [Bacillus paranthracis]